MKVVVLTLFPEVFPSTLGISIFKKSLGKYWFFHTVDLSKFTVDGMVDDTIYGGGYGMLMRPDVLGNAIDFAINNYFDGEKPCIIYPSPRGVSFSTNIAKTLSETQNLIILCARFEGIDYRVIELYDVLEISIGDYIVAGSEVASIVILEAILRFIPNIIGNQESLVDESFNKNMLEYNQYTRPYIWKNMKIPDILISGNHEQIRNWRIRESEKATKLIRPDLFYENFDED